MRMITSAAFKTASWSLVLGGFLAAVISAFNVPPTTPRQQGALAHGSEPSSSAISAQKLQPEQKPLTIRMPGGFEPNQGQSVSQVKFLSRGEGYTLFLTSTEAVLFVSKPTARELIPPSGIEGLTSDDPEQMASKSFPWLLLNMGTDGATSKHDQSATPLAKAANIVRLKLLGGNTKPEILGLNLLPGISNYFIGSNPRKWQTHIHNYAKVQYRQVYPGVDLVYCSSPGQLEYDFVVAPGGDPQAIQLAFEGVDEMRIDPNGDLVLQVGRIEIRQKKPLLYQLVADRRQIVSGKYELSGHRVSFKVNKYDMAQTLVIDPAIQLLTEIGGVTDEGSGRGVTQANSLAVDSAGHMYVAGTTSSLEFPGIAGTPPPASGYTGQAFIAKLNAQGDGLVYATYLGGSDTDYGDSVTVNSAGQAFISGSTSSTDFPTTPGAVQTIHRGVTDLFVAKLSDDGASLLYSTLLGGTESDTGPKLAIDSSGNAYVTGSTSSTDFPTTPGAYQTSFGGGGSDAFAAKLNASGSALVYSTYLGGGGDITIDAAHWIALDRSGNAYVAGSTTSSNFPTTPGAFQTSRVTYYNHFVSKLNPSGTGLAYSTYLSTHERQYFISGMVEDSAGNVIVTGSTSTTDSSGYHTTKLNAAGTGLVYSTIGVGGDGLALDAAENVYIASEDRIVRLNPAGKEPVIFSLGDLQRVPYLLIHDIAIGASNQIYLAGVAKSSPRRGQGSGGVTYYVVANAFVARLPGVETKQTEVFVPIVLSSSGASNSFYTSEMTLTNRGSTDANLLFTYTAAIGTGSGTASDSLPAGRQRIVPDAIAYLRKIGIPIPESGNQGGTLRVRFSGISSAEAAAVTVRTATTLANGRAGLAYSGVAADSAQMRLFKAASGITATDLGMPPHTALTTPCYLPGLRQNAADRSNVAIQNAGTADDGEVTLRLTVSSGNSQAPRSVTLPDVTLPPGGFKQFNAILATSGLAASQGYVRVDRVSGKAPFYAYAVVNDQGTSDGTFLTPVPELALSGETQLILPALVETSAFSSELVLTNWSAVQKTLSFTVGLNVASGTPNFSLSLNSGEQTILPDFVQWLRDHGVAGIGPKGGSYVWALIAKMDSGDASGVFMGSRTTTAVAGGRLGVAYPAVPYDQVTTGAAWIYGLQQNAENRSNLAIVNSAGVDRDYGFGSAGEDTFRMELFDGDTGLKTGTVDSVVINPGEWKQFDNILAEYAPGTTQGYALVIHITGRNPFIAYAVINDGAQPGQRTGDGAFLLSAP